MSFFSFIYRSVRAVYERLYRAYCAIATLIVLKGNQVKYGKGLKCNGVPRVDVDRDGRMMIGLNFKMNNGNRYNKIGRQQPCFFVVSAGAELTIGNNTGISAAAIVCRKKISIGDNVKIGGNVVIYDTDFHSLDHLARANRLTDVSETRNEEVVIGDHAFIGAHSTILKGVNIGNGAIVGAGAVVSKSIPAYEIWAGNPARFVRKVYPEAELVN
jgi:acetyltransferase-like isoleucine patch superfamily enzyme